MKPEIIGVTYHHRSFGCFIAVAVFHFREHADLSVPRHWQHPTHRWLDYDPGRLCFVWKNGRISGIVARAVNFTPFTQLWVLLNTIKFIAAVRR